MLINMNIMECLICLEKLDNNIINPLNCRCKIKLHKKCYQDFLKKSKHNCPICRNSKIYPLNHFQLYLLDYILNILLCLPYFVRYTIILIGTLTSALTIVPILMIYQTFDILTNLLITIYIIIFQYKISFFGGILLYNLLAVIQLIINLQDIFIITFILLGLICLLK